jgi:glycyl-tRNA synthetase
MMPLYDTNGLVFWDGAEIAARDHLVAHFAREVETLLRSINRAWLFYRIEAPTLTPRDLINPNYSDADLWTQPDTGLVLRPETTMGSYGYARKLLADKGGLMPFCVWQAGKSYRKEQDKTLANMRLKEFWQQEFQCLYSETTKADYQALVMGPLAAMLGCAIGRRTRIVESDRLPDYSLKTMDVEAMVEIGKDWMEICSVSVRKDYAQGVRVLELAIGLCRCVRLQSIDNATKNPNTGEKA